MGLRYFVELIGRRAIWGGSAARDREFWVCEGGDYGGGGGGGEGK